MKKTLFQAIVIVFVTAAFCTAALAQDAKRVASWRDFIGEKLVYEAKLNKVLHGMSISEITFVASAAPDGRHMMINSEAVSKGTLTKLFRFSFQLQYESTVDGDLFRIEHTKKHDVQRERVRDSEAVYDYAAKRVTCIEVDPKSPSATPRKMASVIESPMNDYASSIYAARLMPLEIGQDLVIQMSDLGFVYKVPVTVRAREMQKTAIGNVMCLRVEPDIFGKGKLFEREGKMSLWMTDDARRIPVRAVVETEYGKVDIKLKSYTNTKPRP